MKIFSIFSAVGTLISPIAEFLGRVSDKDGLTQPSKTVKGSATNGLWVTVIATAIAGYFQLPADAVIAQVGSVVTGVVALVGLVRNSAVKTRL